MNTEFDTPEGLGLAYLKQFIELFPTSTLALMLTGYFAYSKTVHDNEGSTEELTLAVDRDPYGIILASSRITLQKISLTTLFRMHFQHSRTHC
jgi:superkiller protein 3